MISFQDSKKVESIVDELFPLVIITTIGQLNASRVLIDGGSSCEIIYLSLFEKMYLDRGGLIPYKGLDMQEFKVTIILPQG